MHIKKVIEILSESEESWEKAAQEAVDEASKTIKNVKSIYIKEMTGVVENGKISKYRINGKISFSVEH